MYIPAEEERKTKGTGSTHKDGQGQTKGNINIKRIGFLRKNDFTMLHKQGRSGSD